MSGPGLYPVWGVKSNRYALRLQGKEGGHHPLDQFDFRRFDVYVRETILQEGRFFFRLKISDRDEGVMVEGCGGGELRALWRLARKERQGKGSFQLQMALL